MTEEIVLESAWLTAFFTPWHVRRLPLFGAAIRPDFDAASDVDVPVEFENPEPRAKAILAVLCESRPRTGEFCALNTATTACDIASRPQASPAPRPETGKGRRDVVDVTFRGASPPCA